MDMLDDVDYLTAEQAADKLQLHPRTVRRMLAAGELPGVRIGARQWRVSSGVLRDFVEGRLPMEPKPAPKKKTAARKKPAKAEK